MTGMTAVHVYGGILDDWIQCTCSCLEVYFLERKREGARETERKRERERERERDGEREQCVPLSQLNTGVWGRGRTVQVSYDRTCISARVEWESSTATIAISTSSSFKPIQLMQWSVRSYGHRVAYLYELSCKNGVRSELQMCNRERAGMGQPTLQISGKSIKICSHRTYRTKTEFFLALTRCSWHMQQRQELPTGIWHGVKAGQCWVLELWWLSFYTVQDTVRKLMVSDIMLLTLLLYFWYQSSLRGSANDVSVIIILCQRQVKPS